MARLFLQRAMATFFAIRDGLKDARECKPPYFWALFTDKGEREAMAQERVEVRRKGVQSYTIRTTFATATAWL